MSRSRKLLLVGIFLAATILFLGYLGPAIIQKGYHPEGGPEAIAHNYLLALIRHDYQRAHGYLSASLPQYPHTATAFEQLLKAHDLLPVDNLEACVYLEESQINTGVAEVKLRVQYYDPCLIGIDINNLSFNFATVRLQYNGFNWKIIDTTGGFFYKSWTLVTGE